MAGRDLVPGRRSLPRHSVCRRPVVLEATVVIDMVEGNAATDCGDGRQRACGGHGFPTFVHDRLRMLLRAGGVTGPSRARPPRIPTPTSYSNA